MNKLKLIFAGTPDFAARHLAALLSSDHEVVAVYTQPDKPAGRGQKLTASPGKELALLASLAAIAGLMLSLLTLLRRYPLLRQRSLYQALMFAAFSLYWTAVPMALAGEHGLSQSQIAVFALVGAVGAVAAPMAGRLADAGHARAGSLLALLLAPAALLLGLTVPGYSVIGLGLTGVLLDFAVQMNMVIGQREVYALDPASRGRLNAVYMTSYFTGAASGSALGSAAWLWGGWGATCALGGSIAVLNALALAHDQRLALRAQPAAANPAAAQPAVR